MDAPVGTTGINWVTAIVAWLGSLIIAVVAYSGTVRGARQQAFETEKLRLRHDIARRRLREFDELVREFRGLCLAGEMGERVLRMAETTRWIELWSEVGMAATLVGSPADREEIEKCFRAANVAIAEYSHQCAEFTKMLHLDRDDPKRLGSVIAAELADAHHGFAVWIRRLELVVDWAAERRLDAAAKSVPPSPVDLPELKPGR